MSSPGWYPQGGVSVAAAVPLVAVASDNDDKVDSEETNKPRNIRNRSLQVPMKTKTCDKHKSSSSSSSILRKAISKALGGGIPGAIAGIFQVLTLMWLRTIINYQSRYGATFVHAWKVLYGEGGISRLYRGWGWALLQAPLVRFVSTAANEGVTKVLLQQHSHVGMSTAIAAVVVGVFRILLMPIDTIKTVLQVDSQEGFRNLMRRVKAGKISVLYQGALATAVSSILGHYPWFYTYNYLSHNAKFLTYLPSSKLVQNAVFGFCASLVSDTVTNAVRVVKTTKQAMGSRHDVSYWETIRVVVAADGIRGLFGRALGTRIMANGLQSIVFTVIWRGLAERWSRPSRGQEGDDNDNDDDDCITSKDHQDEASSNSNSNKKDTPEQQHVQTS